MRFSILLTIILLKFIHLFNNFVSLNNIKKKQIIFFLKKIVKKKKKIKISKQK